MDRFYKVWNEIMSYVQFIIDFFAKAFGFAKGEEVPEGEE